MGCAGGGVTGGVLTGLGVELIEGLGAGLTLECEFCGSSEPKSLLKDVDPEHPESAPAKAKKMMILCFAELISICSYNRKNALRQFNGFELLFGRTILANPIKFKGMADF
jgi:hypothetical protein